MFVLRLKKELYFKIVELEPYVHAK